MHPFFLITPRLASLDKTAAWSSPTSTRGEFRSEQTLLPSLEYTERSSYLIAHFLHFLSHVWNVRRLRSHCYGPFPHFSASVLARRSTISLISLSSSHARRLLSSALRLLLTSSLKSLTALSANMHPPSVMALIWMNTLNCTVRPR